MIGTPVRTLAWLLLMTLSGLTGPGSSTPAAANSSAPDLRESALALPGDSWWYPARCEVAYLRPAAVPDLHGGWLALRPLRRGPWCAVATAEALQSPLVEDRRLSAGLEFHRSPVALSARVVRRSLDIVSLRGTTERSGRIAALWRGRWWSAGVLWEPASGPDEPVPLRWIVGGEGSNWRLRLQRRRSAYREATLWDFGFEYAATSVSRLALRWGDAGSSVSVERLRGSMSLRLSAALDGARAGAVGFVVRWR